MDIEALIGRIKKGDSAALKTLYETYTPMMRRVCVNITDEDEHTVNDLVQMTFIRAYYSLNQLRDTSKFGEWVAAIARNISLKYLAQKQKRQLVPFSNMMDEEMEGAMSSDSLLEERELLEQIDHLPKGYRQVLKLHAIEGYSHQEIAEMLGIAPHSSSSQLSRAKAMLRKMINRQGMVLVVLILVCIPLGIYWFGNKDAEDVQKVNMANSKKNGIQPVYKQKPNDVVNVVPVSPVAAMHQNQYRTPIVPMGHLSHDSAYISVDSIPCKSVVVENHDSIQPDTIRFPYNTNIDHSIADNDNNGRNGKWQLLAAGSLGSALAQNVYQMFVGSAGGDIDSGSRPSDPETFSTWEEYYQYLQQKEHGDMSEKKKTLMKIAKNNNGKIVEYEHHYKPITFGIAVTKSPGKRWDLETGLQYSLLKSVFTLGEGAYYIKQTQKVHYLGIPLRVSYKWLDMRSWVVYSSVGGGLNIPVYGKLNEQYVTGLTIPKKSDWHITPPLQWSVGTGVGIQYKLAPHWGIYLEPSLNWFVPNGSACHTIWTEHPLSITVPLGIRYSW